MKKRGLLLLGLLALIVAIFIARQALVPRVIAWPQLSGSLKAASIQHRGLTRQFHIYRPAQLADNAPLLLVFHGSMSDGLSMRELGGNQFDRLADEQGVLLVYPDGYKRHWNDCRATANYEANTNNIDDVGFVRALLVQLQAEYGIDLDQVYATGLSNGGHMALRLALEAPDLIAGAAPIAANMPAADYFDCQPTGRAVNIALLAGTNDPVNPYEGGLVKILWDESRGVVQSAAATAEYFAGLAGYGGEPPRQRLPDTETNDDGWIEVQHWQGRDKQVAFYTLVGGGHTFPSRHTRFGAMLGGDNRDIDTADLIWAFFRGAGAALCADC